jgi:hypothetical protein
MADILEDVLASALGLLAGGAADPGHAWRNPTLVTTGLDGTPQARTVVLRRFDPAARQAELHTDTRSTKYAELLARPKAGLHGWDADAKIQLRLTGSVTLHRADDVADAAWAALRPQSRATWRVSPGPGTVLPAPAAAGEMGEADARQVFCVVRLGFDRLEWLHLGQVSHRRARFAWAQGARTATWLVP